MAPIDINNQEISSITLNGNTEINTVEVNGQEVFSAETLPVAYSNLVAWYPFDSATYGGSNADDVTAILGGSADDTAYDLNENGVSYQSNGGVTDISAGANSGDFLFDGSGDDLERGGNYSLGTTGQSICFWAKLNTSGGNNYAFDSRGAGGSVLFKWSDNDPTTINAGFTSYGAINHGSDFQQYTHWTLTSDGVVERIYKNGSKISDNTTNGGLDPSWRFNPVGNSDDSGGDYSLDGQMDDLRVYEKELSASEVNQIYLNTEP